MPSVLRRYIKSGQRFRWHTYLNDMTVFQSHADLSTAGILSTEALSLQYCLDVGLLRPHHFCEDCQTYMTLKSCASSKYRDGFYWVCPAGHVLSVRTGSVLYKRSIPFSRFLHLLWLFCARMSVSDATRLLSMNIKTIRPLFKSIRHCMAPTTGVITIPSSALSRIVYTLGLQS